MHIKDKVLLDYEDFIKEGPITIVAFGDSVTHGALNGTNNYETVYWERLRQKIIKKYNTIPVNVINAGIGGITATRSVERLEKQVITHNPDLVIVCFGLNDVGGELDDYINSLTKIFKRLKKTETDIIFMTPNMLNTYFDEENTPKEHLEYAKVTAEWQNNGRMDLYMEKAVELANKMNICVCDCYKKWKELSKTQDTTKLLINRINHPTPEMHKLFAESLYDIIFSE